MKKYLICSLFMISYVYSNISNIVSFNLSILDNTHRNNISETLGTPEKALFKNQLPTLNISFGRDNETFPFLLNTGRYYTAVINKNCTECVWADPKYNDTESKTRNSDKYIKYSFGEIIGSIITDKMLIENYIEDLYFFSASDSKYFNTEANFSGILGIGAYKNQDLDNSNYIFIENSELANKFVGIDYSKQKFYLGGLPEIYDSKSITNCTNKALFSKNPLYNYWGCKLDYILIGEDHDFYLADYINRFAIFDSLSYFHIAPYSNLENFQNSYFTGNNNCTVNSLDINETLFRFECFVTEKFEKINPFFIILNGWGYKLGSNSLFDPYDNINIKNTKENVFYSRILFSKTRDYWTIGNGIFNKFVVGYNYTLNKSFFYTHDPKDIIDFTKYTHEDMIEEKELFNIILTTFGLFLLLMIIIIWVAYHFKQKKLESSFKKEILLSK